MRQYIDQEKRVLEKIVCNRCGRELQLEKGLVQEGVFTGDVQWGYFSRHDGERHHFDLCEECYEHLISSFRIPVEKEDETELL